MNRTLRQLARDAIEVQDACNLSGVVHAFSETIRELREIMPTIGTRELGMHPIVRMWASKIHDLAGMGLSDTDRYGEAYEWCCEHQEKDEF